MPRDTLTIINQRGLHARAAAKFVKLAGTFGAEISISKDGTQVSGLSIMGLMMLAAAPGDAIDISVEGVDADAALAALSELVRGGFGEE
ncbi:MAG: HPr family phosphocarrier protein [Rhodospirillales bacterium]|jgi:phosphocarrier protein|nr:HPr family phosphocarrier protein [Rhodospirillaceae bacterium]MDP6430124.1 HPr family phosphocarrier protein [Rhodospirillales bacterium]MDP6645824.1 HPr family phosphocarrier protein [Rhodospirillales bacterium]MDP6842389.1 HPr family phosphocarrier protein [Rhodospirillales bacterium]|tara:strand:+ start:1145 stop:1411 length:267 start_codon:yes stop_codon:yes gene_type:complete